MRLLNIRIGKKLNRWLAFRNERCEWLYDVLFRHTEPSP